MHPKAVKPSFVDRNNPDRGAAASLRLHLRPCKNHPQLCSLGGSNGVLADFVTARRVDRDQPTRLTQLQSYKNRSIISSGGNRGITPGAGAALGGLAAAADEVW